MKEDLPGTELKEEVDGLGVGLGVLADVGLKNVGTEGGHGGDGDFAATVLLEWSEEEGGTEGGSVGG